MWKSAAGVWKGLETAALIMKEAIFLMKQTLIMEKPLPLSGQEMEILCV